MLRKGIMVYAGLAMLGALALAIAGVVTMLVLYLFANGAIVLVAILFERGRYRSPASSQGPWQETGERFVDPSTGQLTKVRYNPQTGERDYVALSPLPDPRSGEEKTLSP
jgi:hypothetical protein